MVSPLTFDETVAVDCSSKSGSPKASAIGGTLCAVFHLVFCEGTGNDAEAEAEPWQDYLRIYP